jgi:hypothetical protein
LKPRPTQAARGGSGKVKVESRKTDLRIDLRLRQLIADS